MVNRLANSNSPYLLQHADNPVEWYPWGEEALQAARQQDRPIFLSIGYAACHWCHVMAHESFEDPHIALIMNANFINIKVDREERPDLDSIYMNAAVAIAGQGGWPMSVFLTPDGRPFYAGTYFPPTPRYNMPSFRDVLMSIAKSWREEREKVFQAGDQLSKHIQSVYLVDSPQTPLNLEALDKAALALAQSYDWKNGGWGKAPKFPQPMAIEFLLRRVARGDKLALEIAVHALKSMARGGMYDSLGGGFARYSTDDRWLVPHFEKMLYDNALLARAYLHAYLLTGDQFFRQVCEETLDFIVREMTGPEGGFYSSLDADSEGEEGKYYVWKAEEIEAHLLDPGEAEIFMAAYGVSKTGNFEGKNILHLLLTDEQLAEVFQLRVQEIRDRLAQARTRLLKARSARVRPVSDDKVLTAWNALAQVAFSEAARYLGRDDYLLVAIRNTDFLLSTLHPADRLLRSWRAGQALHNAFLEDYATLILALIALYQSHPEPRWFENARRLGKEMLIHFRDPAGGFFDTRQDHETLIARPKDIQDNATPSGNSLAATALLLLSAYTGSGEWRDFAEEMFADVLNLAISYPIAFSNWLYAMDAVIYPISEVAILGDLSDPRSLELKQALWSQYRPNVVAALASFPPPAGVPELLLDRPLLYGSPTAYICQNFVCQRPVTSVAEFLSQLNTGTSQP
ncbi:MAG TPA: thioredoxin domain-containing protein [Anaerolineales bacterium]|nr:thioredoxin domain-containing protein [Anaerolineales bacterium]